MVAGNGFGSWTVQYRDRDAKVVRAHGLGSAAATNLPQARAAAADFKSDIRRGIIPAYRSKGSGKSTARPALAVPGGTTFREAVATYLQANASDWAPSEQVRHARLLGEPCARIADKPFRAVTTADVVEVLQPIWKGPNAKPGALVRSLIERVLSSAATLAGVHDYNNPAQWRGRLEHVMSKTSPEVEHHAAMDYAAVPAFLAHAADPVLTFLVLTASRLSEVTEMDPAEVVGNVWTIPGARYKTGKAHVVPLSAAALACLPLPRGTDKHALYKLLKGTDATIHGFRSTFRDWAREVAKAPDDVAEMCLGHATGTKITRAYKRGELLPERRALLEQRAIYLA